ncbi:MAG: glycosyltransferase family 4 protein [Thermoleophilia bacterium]
MKRDKNIRSGPCKIGIDLSILNRVETGTSVYAKNLFQALLQLDQSAFEFIALSGPRPLPRKNIFSKLGNFMMETIWLGLLLPLQVRRRHIELLHMPGNTISPFLAKPQVCSIHDAHFITNPQGRDLLWRLYARLSFRFAARHADRILCDSLAAKDEIVKLLGAGPEKIDVIHPGIPHRKSGADDDEAVTTLKPYILSVGATEPNKNFSTLLRAFSQLAKKNETRGHRLVLAGPPGHDHSRLKELIRRLNLGDQVVLLGHIPDTRLAALYDHASLFIFPSFCEGFGFPPLEAMLSGVPVVASNAPCLPETLGQAPIYFNPKDASELSEKMRAVLSDPQLRKKLAGAGLARAREFTWENTALQTAAVYRSVLRYLPGACQ